jgi:hypothetical protein
MNMQPYWYTALRMNDCEQHADCKAMVYPMAFAGVGKYDKYPTRQLADRKAWELAQLTKQRIVVIKVEGN